MQNGVVLWGNSVIVPEPGWLPILDELHQGHPGFLHISVYPHPK